MHVRRVLPSTDVDHAGISLGTGDRCRRVLDDPPVFSLVSGWLPVTIQIAVAAVLLAAVGWRTRRWRFRWVPLALALGVAAAVPAAAVFAATGWSSERAPLLLWTWVGAAVAATTVMVVGWPSAGWGRRVLSVAALPLCVLCAGVVLNEWVGLVPTVADAYRQATGAPVSERFPGGGLPARGPATASPAGPGQAVAVTIPAATSGFTPRQQYVYLPPAWFAAPAPPRLPVIMMIGAEFSAPADWIRAGDAVATADVYTRGHHGYGPILVFVDAAGRVGNDTECVNGPHGHVADYLTRDVRAWVISQLGAPTDPRWWSVAGWSMGGTCAVDLAVTHPELFATFQDISGDLGPNTGTVTQTIARLYGGDRGAWARFDPLTVLSGHPRYPDSAGLFDAALDSSGRGGADLDAARQLCSAATRTGIACTVRNSPGRHTWQFAAHAFGTALPWLVERSIAPAAPPPPSS
jgi:S-formylglutathione hydrolase FrmB